VKDKYGEGKGSKGGDSKEDNEQVKQGQGEQRWP
jgi:hypothetical protein